MQTSAGVTSTKKGKNGNMRMIKSFGGNSKEIQRRRVGSRIVGRVSVGWDREKDRVHTVHMGVCELRVLHDSWLVQVSLQNRKKNLRSRKDPRGKKVDDIVNSLLLVKALGFRVEQGRVRDYDKKHKSGSRRMRPGVHQKKCGGSTWAFLEKSK